MDQSDPGRVRLFSCRVGFHLRAGGDDGVGEPVEREPRGDQLDAEYVGIFSRRTNRTQHTWVYSHLRAGGDDGVGEPVEREPRGDVQRKPPDHERQRLQHHQGALRVLVRLRRRLQDLRRDQLRRGSGGGQEGVRRGSEGGQSRV